METIGPLPEVMGEELAILILICPSLIWFTREKLEVSVVVLASPITTREGLQIIVKSPARIPVASVITISAFTVSPGWPDTSGIDTTIPSSISTLKEPLVVITFSILPPSSRSSAWVKVRGEVPVAAMLTVKGIVKSAPLPPLRGEEALKVILICPSVISLSRVRSEERSVF
jgi:hypothetical protein